MSKPDCHGRRSAAQAILCVRDATNPLPTCITCGATRNLDFLDLPGCIPAGPRSGWYCKRDGMAAIGFCIHLRAVSRLARGGVPVRPLIARSWKSFSAARAEGGAQALNYSLELERAVRKLIEVIQRDT